METNKKGCCHGLQSEKADCMSRQAPVQSRMFVLYLMFMFSEIVLLCDASVVWSSESYGFVNVSLR
ncbi:hypothetical protein Plhal304r1_c035g0109901 [Plasmopara halstedii]